MCDCNPGRVILIHDREDQAGRELVESIQRGKVPDIEYATSMDRLTHGSGRSELHLLKVNPGEELWTANTLQFRYQTAFVGHLESGHITPNSYAYSLFTDPDRHMVAAPDSVVDFADAPTPAGFSFSETHDQYKSLMHLSGAAETGAGVHIAIIDSGLDPMSGIPISTASRAFHDDAVTRSIDDENGHGTAVASVIHDIAPDAELTVLKVGDRNPMSEWNLIAAMLSGADADVMNLSMAFSLRARDCGKCGRKQSHSSRSTIFSRVLRSMATDNPDLIIVAAAGNRSLDRVDYPARYSNVVAVGAVDSSLKVATYSNTGAVDESGNDHKRLYFAPGGSEQEYVGTTIHPNGEHTDHEGTSFAAPYVSALLARRLQSTKGVGPHATDAALERLTLHADIGMVDYDYKVHGNGFVRY